MWVCEGMGNIDAGQKYMLDCYYLIVNNKMLITEWGLSK